MLGQVPEGSLLEIRVGCVFEAFKGSPTGLLYDVESGLASDAHLPTRQNSDGFDGSTKVV